MKKNSKKDFPGYPHYKQEEDIMSNSSKEKRIDVNLDGTNDKISPTQVPQTEKGRSRKNEIDLVPGNDADVSEEEKKALENEGELQDKIFSPSDLDVPGSELDDANEEIGEEDEENNNYSQGADRD